MYGIIRLWSLSMLSLLLLFILVVLAFGGAFRVVDGAMIFEIEGFEEFRKLDSDEKKDAYVESGELNFCERENVYFIPFIKDASSDDCAILLRPYSKNVDKVISIREILLTTADGKTICRIEEYGETEVISQWGGSAFLVGMVMKSEEWFYSGNELTLHIKASVKDGEEWIPIETSYKVVLRGTKMPALQV